MEAYKNSIFKVVEYIESRISHEITLEELSREALFSKFHFSRMFKSITNETIYEYIRKRRFTVIAGELIESKIPLIQLAFKYGYGSQEAFSRAFKAYMGASPSEYRKERKHYYNLYKNVISVDSLQLIKNAYTQNTHILELSGIYIAGIPLTENVNNHTISKHWNVFYKELLKLHINPDTVKCFGYESMHKDGELFYMPAIQVSHSNSLPKNWTLKYIPPHKYAVVSLPNRIDYIPYVIKEIYLHILPSLNVEPTLDFNLEVYTEDFKANDTSYFIPFLLPIK